jgi:gas vesicle protein
VVTALEAAMGYDWDGLGDDLAGIMRPYYADLFGLAYDDANDVLPTQVSFDLSNPHIKKTIDGLAKRIKGVSATMKEDVRGWVERGTEEGLTTKQIAEQIRSKAEDIGKSRSEMIARTESATAYNLGGIHAYEDGGISKVEVLDGDDDEDCSA